jgi:hypothetical protein
MFKSIEHEHLKGGNGDGPRVWLRRHDYMPDGYTLMEVALLLDGTYEGSMVIGHLTRRIAPFTAKTITLKECCDTLDRWFWENMPDHQCRSGCFNWATQKTIFDKPSGRVQ